MQNVNKQSLNLEKSESLNTKLSGALLLPQAVTAAIELLINKALRLNTKSLNLTGLSQKTLAIKLAELPFPLCFTVNNTFTTHEVIVRTQTENSDCVINTSLSTLKRLKAQESLTQLIKQDQLDVAGDINTAQQFANIAKSLEIDWQTELAKHLGDIPTHNLLHFGNKITKSISATCKQLQADLGEYIVHEKRLVVTNSQITTFNQEVTTVVNSIDNLSIRINNLVAKASNIKVTS